MDLLSINEKAVVIKNGSSQTDTSTNKLKGKKVVLYGDSITAQNYYLPLISSYFGCNILNMGIGGTKVCAPNSEGNSFCSITRLQTIPNDADYILVMGGTNDWNGSKIGDLNLSSTTLDTTTFKGGLAFVIKYITEKYPNAKLIICTAIGGRGKTKGVSGLFPLIDQYGQSTLDFRNATIEVASMFNTDVCDTWSCGINNVNRVAYIEDTVHPTKQGAELIANYIINYLKKFN